MTRLFGTDGVRGIANTQLSCELVYRMGQAGALELTNGAHAPRILIGRDTRVSGEMLLHALIAGICSVGAEAVDLGIIPTPGVAYLTRHYGADAAVVISASHNSFEYNGIKWFTGEGFKLSDEIEDRIELRITKKYDDSLLPTGLGIGKYSIEKNAQSDYLKFLNAHAKQNLSHLSIVVDSANGAASTFAPALFEKLGMKVHTIFASPDGSNINAKCGSQHPQCLQQAVIEKNADAGFAFDGDADRLVAVDEKGAIVNGDHIMALCALEMKKQNQLKENTLVTTVMSNLGMKNSMIEAGITVLETDVGDRYVLEAMREGGFNLGGEQSGHMIFLDENSTGDGMLGALHVLDIMAKNQKSLATLTNNIPIYPQVLVNVQVPNEHKYAFRELPVVSEKISTVAKQFGNRGRILVRASGTEPLIRIMLEGEDEKLIRDEALAIATLLETHCEGLVR